MPLVSQHHTKFCFTEHHRFKNANTAHTANYYKILESDGLLTGSIWALIGQCNCPDSMHHAYVIGQYMSCLCNWTVRVICSHCSRAVTLNGLLFSCILIDKKQTELLFFLATSFSSSVWIGKMPKCNQNLCLRRLLPFSWRGAWQNSLRLSQP